jgi:hypothetical protein
VSRRRAERDYAATTDQLTLSPEPERDEWVSDGHGSYFNAGENRRLAALGHVPLTEPAGGARRCGVERRPEARQPAVPVTRQERPMAAATTKKRPAKKSALTGLSKAKLRTYLLEHQTIPDRAWNAAYGAPAREKGETRAAYIRRVLA